MKHESKCIKEVKPFELTLNDCLACSGCITNDEENMLRQGDYQRLIDNDDAKKMFVISPYSKIKIYDALNLSECSFRSFESHLAHFLVSSCNATEVVDSSYYQRTVLERVAAEFFEAKAALITSDCPGTVAYIERNGKHLIANLSRVQTPQQIAAECNERVVSVVPCYDKKMENGRDGCTMDYVLHTQEFLSFLHHKGFAAAGSVQEAALPQKTTIFASSFSGGYTEFLAARIGAIRTSTVQVNKNYWVHTLECANRTYTLHKVYGIKNVLNLINRTRKGVDFDFAEVFLCESACASGPLVDASAERIEQFYASFESDGEGIALGRKGKEREFAAYHTKRTHFTVEW